MNAAGRANDTHARAELEQVTWGLGLDNVLVELMQRERDALSAGSAVGGAPPALDRLRHRGPER